MGRILVGATNFKSNIWVMSIPNSMSDSIWGLNKEKASVFFYNSFITYGKMSFNRIILHKESMLNKDLF